MLRNLPARECVASVRCGRKNAGLAGKNARSEMQSRCRSGAGKCTILGSARASAYPTVWIAGGNGLKAGAVSPQVKRHDPALSIGEPHPWASPARDTPPWPSCLHGEGQCLELGSADMPQKKYGETSNIHQNWPVGSMPRVWRGGASPHCADRPSQAPKSRAKRDPGSGCGVSPPTASSSGPAMGHYRRCAPPHARRCKRRRTRAPVPLRHGQLQLPSGGSGPLQLSALAPPPPLCDIPFGCCSFTGPWTVTRSSLCMLRWVAAFCWPLRPVLLLVSFPRSQSPVVGVLGLCMVCRLRVSGAQ